MTHVGREILETIVAALFIFLVIQSAVRNYRVEGPSMNPTLASGDYILVNRSAYSKIDLNMIDKILPFINIPNGHYFPFNPPKRGEIVVFSSEKMSGRATIKRVIGEPGDTIAVRGGVIYLNGVQLDEPYIVEPMEYVMVAKQIPYGHYFVLGDNRNVSLDSHEIGTVPLETIQGQAKLRYWPPSNFGLFHGIAEGTDTQSSR